MAPRSHRPAFTGYLVAVALIFAAVPSPVLAAAAPPVEAKQLSQAADKALADGDKLAGAGDDRAAVAKYLEAARLFTQLAESVPASDPYRGVKQSDRANQALFAYEQANAAHSRAQQQPLQDTTLLTMLSSLIGMLDARLGEVEAGSEEANLLGESRRQLETERVRLDAIQNPPAPEPEAEPAPEPELEPAPEPEPEVTPAPLPTPPPDSPPEQKKPIGLTAGLWTSVGLTVAAGATGTALLITTRTGGGSHNKIVDAAVSSNSYDPFSNNLCANPGSPPVGDQCSRHKTLSTTGFVMLGVAGAFAISSAVFAGLLARKRKQMRSTRASASNLHLAVSPDPRGGFALSGHLRF